MKTRERILIYLKEKNEAGGVEIAEFLGISRQAVNKHLKKFVEQGIVKKEGRTKGTIFRIASKKNKIEKVFKKSYDLKNLEEHVIFGEIELLLNLRKNLNHNVFEIVNYAFTEILNNALEHSLSEKCKIEVILSEYAIEFTIRDFGIGIFYSIYSKFNLPDEESAMAELLKGKITTMAEKHSGEGVFFTSKSGDVVKFRSHKLNLIFDNVKKDIFVEERRLLKGTEVIFNVSRNSRRKLDEIFKQFAPEDFDYRFERTKVMVKIFQKECVSRSEARRLLSGLNKFNELTLDFKDVKTMGQGFADEIFRVFRIKYPNIIIKTENVSSALQQMINHIVDKKI